MTKKVKNTARLTAALLSALMLAACTPAQGNPSVTDATGAQTTTKATDATSSVTDETKPVSHLDPVDYGGAAVNFLEMETRQYFVYHYNVFAPEVTGETINDSLHRRNLVIEDKYKVTLNSTQMPYTEIFNEVAKTVNANLDSYDAVFNYGSGTVNAAVSGYLVDLNTLEDLDFSQPWWMQDAISSTSIGGVNCFALGDVTATSFTSVVGMYFNKQLNANLGLESPYTLVKENKWTYDKFLSLVSQASSDLNGNGAPDAADQYGFGSSNFCWMPFVYGSGARLIEKDADDHPVLNLSTERNLELIDNMITLVNDEANCYYLTRYSGGIFNPFKEGRILFICDLMYSVFELRDMEIDFGIIPFPKYDEAQENYYSYIHDKSSYLSVPKTCQNLDRTGRILEDMGCYTYAYVRPSIIEVLLKGKSARDAESAEMLDIVFDFSNIKLDLLQPLGAAGLKADSIIRGLLDNNTHTAASTFERLAKPYDKILRNVTETFEGMKS